MPKNLIIIGSTGNIGTQALEVIRANSQDFTIAGLAAHSNQNALNDQIKEFNPKYSGTLCSAELLKMVTQPDIDIILFACRSTDHLDVLKAAIKADKHIAIANKEIIVEHGEEIMPLVRDSNCIFVPVDSEHSAIFQILQNRNSQDIEKITITCSGGSLYNEDLENITLEQATSHPKWDMGQ